MALRSPEQYRESLRDGRNVYVAGQRVEDVTTHPAMTASDFAGYIEVGTVHGEGSLQAQLLGIYRDYDFNRSRSLVQDILARSVDA
ncbi:4-hydroxyphenylacetate 3-hydroxylase N-terminal domain-containing protein [Caldinitratiruptor microaerophilus]|uniref:HpaB/PvcC/4-BUDH N-terminal domain-containing protein n=1 Tax=Caldinitratiruptor microaerophilus TaxID=671077 RepID=A0AA35G596_9FIRM|nr:4-hydroxyphenylacetate 3-hydroxylase N-terminal domain-containing protein [Caldinitratiruptor microaerophilus]BDG58981.1 hypothetical protein caldi_00710 [Caldinitratiruptor microaerophilus]